MIRESLKKISGRDVVAENQDKIASGMHEMRAFNDRIAEFLEHENSHIRTMKDTMQTVDRILIKPIEIFEEFVSRITNSYPSFQHPYPSSKNPSSKNPPSNQSFVPLHKMQAFYDDLNSKRQDNAISTNRLFAELIRTLRDSMPTSKGRHHQHHQDEKSEERLEKSRVVRDGALDKKVRDLQSQKIKNR